MIKNLMGGWDGRQAIIRLNLKNLGVARDASFVATECYITDSNNVLIARRPGSIVGNKSDGTVDILLNGRELDFEGLGGWVWLKFKFYVGVGLDGNDPVQLLLNSSFDTDGNADGVADNWSKAGTPAAVYVVGSDDPAPGTIYQNGQYQSVKHNSLGDNDYLQQGASTPFAIGDPFSVGVWHRVSGPAGVQSNDHAIFFRTGANPNSYVQFKAVESDWYFAYGTVFSQTAESTMTMGFLNRATTMLNRFDDAFGFKGTWRVVTQDPVKYYAHPRRRTPKSSNQIAGIGSFEVDSNADGLADGWKKSSNHVFSLNALNIQHGSRSQQVVMTSDTTSLIWTSKRGAFRAGETWRFSIYLKTSGALTGAGQLFGIVAQSDPFNDTPVISSNFTSFASDTGGVFVQYTTDIVIGTTVDLLNLQIYLRGRNGTIWLDNAELKRTVP